MAEQFTIPEGYEVDEAATKQMQSVGFVIPEGYEVDEEATKERKAQIAYEQKLGAKDYLFGRDLESTAKQQERVRQEREALLQGQPRYDPIMRYGEGQFADPIMRKMREEAAQSTSSLPAIIREPINAAERTGATLLSTAARPFSKDVADYVAQTGEVLDTQAQAERKGDLWGETFSRMYGGASQSILQAGAMAPAGPYGMAAGFALTEGNQALYEAEKAGLKGSARFAYAATQGVIEGGVMAAFNAIGMPGMEGLIPKIADGTMKSFGKEFVKASLEELPEEILTEAYHAIAEGASQVDPTALNPDQLVQRMIDTVGQTLLAVGGATAAGTLTRNKEMVAELEKVREKGFVSEQDGKELGLSPEEMTNRKTRAEAVDRRVQGLQEEIQNAEVSNVQGTEETGQAEVQAGEEVAPEEQVLDRFQGMTPEQIQQHQQTEAEVGSKVMTPSEEATAEKALEEWQKKQIDNSEIEAALARQPEDQPEVTLPEVPVKRPLRKDQTPREKAQQVQIEREGAPQSSEKYEPTTPEQIAARDLRKKTGRKDQGSSAMLETLAAAEAAAPEAPSAKRPLRKEQPTETEVAPGITIKKTPKGSWSVTGLPDSEITDGLRIDYQGTKTKKGYVFKLDPTEGLRDVARQIKEQAEVDSAERARGRRRTSIGYMAEKQAEAFNQERAERLNFEKQQIKERNDAINSLLPKGWSRSDLKQKLIQAEKAGTDYTTIEGFDQIFARATGYHEANSAHAAWLPQDQSELFHFLIETPFNEKIDEKTLLDKIDDELAAEFESAMDEGDTSFDFGMEVKPPAGVPGEQMGLFEADEQKQLFNVSRPKRGKSKPVEPKQSELEKIDEDLKGQRKESLAGQKVISEDEGESTTQGTKKSPKKPSPKTKLQESADKATKEAFDELELFGKTIKAKGLFANAPLDPEVIAGAARVVAKFAKAGTLKFAAVIEHLTNSIGKAAVDRIRPVLESEWDKAHASGEFPGMEPRVAKSVGPIGPNSDDLTGIKKAVVNDMRKLVGLPEMEGSTPQTVEEWAEAARVTLENDPKAAEKLVNQLATNPRPISQHETMLLQFRYRQLANEIKPVVDELFAAVKTGDPNAIAAAELAVVKARAPMTEFEAVIHPMKETWGRTGVALQQLLRKDFSIEAILRRGQEANQGEELSAKQTAELTEISNRLEAKQKEFDELRKKTDALEAELASKKQHEQAIKEVKQRNIRRKSERRQAAEKKVSDAWAEFKKAATGRLGAGVPVDLLAPAVNVAKAYVELGYVRFGEFMASVRQHTKDPDEALFRQAWEQVAPKTEVNLSDKADLTREARRIQRTLVEAGITEREKVIDAVHESLKEVLPEITRRQTMDALSRYGQFQTQSKGEIETIIRGMNSEVLKLSQIDQQEIALKRVEELRKQGKSDEEIGNALQKEKLLVEATGLVRDNPSETIRQLTQKYNENKKGIPASSEGKAGLLQTAISSIERGLLNRIEDLTWEIENKQKIVKESRERPTTDRIKQLEAERDALRKIHQEMFPKQKKQMTDAQRVAAAIRGSDKAIELLEAQLKTRDFDIAKRPSVSSPVLEAKRARLKQLRAAREAAKAFELSQFEEEGGATPKGKIPLTPEQRARRIYESSLTKRIADYQQILAEGDFSPKPKKGKRTLSDSELKLKREMEDLKLQALEKFEEYRISHLSGLAWTYDKIREASHLGRAINTAFDVSALMRQGGLTAMGHPDIAAKALTETVSSIAHTFDSANAKALLSGPTLENAKKFMQTIDSRQAEFDFMHRIMEGPQGELRQQAGLELPSSDREITKQEEAFQGRWAKHVPGVDVSGRLYTMILNKMRADLFDSMVQNLGRGGEVTMPQAKLIANFVNAWSGRSGSKFIKNHSATLNLLFFASNWVASRFQVLAMPATLPFKGGLKADWNVKRAIYKEYARSATGIATVLGAFALAAALFYDDDDEDKPTIELDPNSSDFLKVKIGETRLDFLAGLQQVFVFSHRMLPDALGGGEVKSASGKVSDLDEDGYNAKTRLDVAESFARSKLAPVPGAIATIGHNMKTVVGEKKTPLSLATDLVTPLSAKDILRTMEEQGTPKGTAMGILSMTGVGVNTYGPKTNFRNSTKSEQEDQIKKLVKAAKQKPVRKNFKSQENFENAVQKRNKAQEDLRDIRSLKK